MSGQHERSDESSPPAPSPNAVLPREVAAELDVTPLFRVSPGVILDAATAQELVETSELRRRAQRAGYREGLEAGLARIAQRLEALETEWQRRIETAEEDIVTLAIRVAERVLHQSITTDRGRVLDLVREMRQTMGRDPADIELLVGTEAAAMLGDGLERTGLRWRVVTDAAPWALRLKTPSSVLDFGLERQLAAVEEALRDSG